MHERVCSSVRNVVAAATRLLSKHAMRMHAKKKFEEQAVKLVNTRGSSVVSVSGYRYMETRCAER